MEFIANTLDEKVRFIQASKRHTTRQLADYCTVLCGRPISREYIRRLSVEPGRSGHIPEPNADADVLAALSLIWDIDLAEISKLAADRSEKLLELHQRVSGTGPQGGGQLIAGYVGAPTPPDPQLELDFHEQDQAA